MFRIRRVADEVLPANRKALEQVKAILRQRFPAVPQEEIDQLGRHLHDPFLKRYRRALAAALRRITDFEPDFLLVALGLDTAKGDRYLVLDAE